MKNPNSASGAGVFPVTSSATLASSVDATLGRAFATQFERRFRWCSLSNSVQPLRLEKGVLTHD